MCQIGPSSAEAGADIGARKLSEQRHADRNEGSSGELRREGPLFHLAPDKDVQTRTHSQRCETNPTDT